MVLRQEGVNSYDSNDINFSNFNIAPWTIQYIDCSYFSRYLCLIYVLLPRYNRNRMSLCMYNPSCRLRSRDSKMLFHSLPVASSSVHSASQYTTRKHDTYIHACYSLLTHAHVPYVRTPQVEISKS